MRIAVIGAGIAGLATAVGLQRDGHEVVVVERRAALEPVGGGLTLFGNAFAALDALGLGDAVRAVSSSAIASMRAGMRTERGRWLLTVPPSSTRTMRSVHRAVLHRVLEDTLEPGTLRLATEGLVAPDGSGGLDAHGSAEQFDLVVAADGIASRNRAVLGLDPGLRYAGVTAWRGVTTRPVELHGEAGETLGRGRSFGVVPLPDDRLYWYGTLATPAGTEFPDDRQAALDAFAGWHEPIDECIAATDSDAVLRHDLYDLARPLPAFHRGRTVLLGDAAHAMTPNLGQGAGQGLEDAAVLVAAIRGASPGEVLERLAHFSALRRPRTQLIARQSRTAGRMRQLANPAAVGFRNAVLRCVPGAAFGAASARVQRWAPPA